ncbi:hypothetical protein HC864_03625 [Candidatus Gracilibacteria bacterium]|nr:hypothetical protein [Thermales bacterium]NJL96873.1 hypothetical protein [Candidatus Gracilibacteria bacterium]
MKKIISFLNCFLVLGLMSLSLLTPKAFATSYNQAFQNCSANYLFPLSQVYAEGSGWRCLRKLQIFPFVTITIANYYIA